MQGDELSMSGLGTPDVNEEIIFYHLCTVLFSFILFYISYQSLVLTSFHHSL